MNAWLFRCQIELIYQDLNDGERSVASRIADSTELWWNARQPYKTKPSLWESKIELRSRSSAEVNSRAPDSDARTTAHPSIPELHEPLLVRPANCWPATCGTCGITYPHVRTSARRPACGSRGRCVYRQLGVGASGPGRVDKATAQQLPRGLVLDCELEGKLRARVCGRDGLRRSTRRPNVARSSSSRRRRRIPPSQSTARGT